MGYLVNRAHIYTHYKDKGRIAINIFQDRQAMAREKKIETNAERMLEGIRQTRVREQENKPVRI